MQNEKPADFSAGFFFSAPMMALKKLSATPTKMKPRIGDITFDAQSPVAMANFWSALLGYAIEESTEDFAAIIDDEINLRLVFQRSDTPKVGKNRVHLDIFVADMEAEVQRAITLGAQKIRTYEEEVSWTVMLDVEENEFCIQPELRGKT